MANAFFCEWEPGTEDGATANRFDVLLNFSGKVFLFLLRNIASG